MHLGVTLVAQAPEVVQVCEAALDEPALAAEAGAVGCSAARDHGRDPEGPQEPAVLVVVIATIGQDTVWLLAWLANLAGHRPRLEVCDQRE